LREQYRDLRTILNKKTEQVQLSAAGAALAFLAESSLVAGVAFRLGAAEAEGFFGSAFAVVDLAGAAVADSGLAFVTLGDVGFFGLAPAASFLTVALVFAPAAAVEDFVASRGDRRVGPVDGFFGGIVLIKSNVRTM